MKPHYEDHHIKIFNKDCRSMDEIPANSIQCVVTSPPYWGLRKYSGEQELIWGNNLCEHQWGNIISNPMVKSGKHGPASILTKTADEQHAVRKESNQGSFCQLCSAWCGAFGLEPAPEMYIQHTIEILREIRRVLRKDGVVFWNIGDSYWGGKGQSGQPMDAATQQERHGRGESINQAQHQLEMSKRPQDGKHYTIKPKDLCLIPFRLGIAAQEDGWWIRSVIIWSKPNPMPESITDRPTESHEYILMMTKSKTYYWDADAVREPHQEVSINRMRYGWHGNLCEGHKMGGIDGVDKMETCHPLGRNIRSVWEFPTQPYPEAHFAVFPEKLPELCIKAATPEVGCCAKCGAPWERITKDIRHYKNIGRNASVEGSLETGKRYQDWYQVESQTLGWQPTCKCNADKVPSIVLDPFAGAGTTLWVAKKLGRKAIGYEISEEYCELSLNRNRQQVFI